MDRETRIITNYKKILELKEESWEAMSNMVAQVFKDPHNVDTELLGNELSAKMSLILSQYVRIVGETPKVLNFFAKEE